MFESQCTLHDAPRDIQSAQKLHMYCRITVYVWKYQLTNLLCLIKVSHLKEFLLISLLVIFQLNIF